jgi:hypothetical protein
LRSFLICRGRARPAASSVVAHLRQASRAAGSRSGEILGRCGRRTLMQRFVGFVRSRRRNMNDFRRDRRHPALGSRSSRSLGWRTRPCVPSNVAARCVPHSTTVSTPACADRTAHLPPEDLTTFPPDLRFGSGAGEMSAFKVPGNYDGFRVKHSHSTNLWTR